MFVRSVKFYNNSNRSTVVGGKFLLSFPASLLGHFDLTTIVQATGSLQPELTSVADLFPFVTTVRANYVFESDMERRVGV